MGRMKIGIVAGSVLVVLLGVVAAVTLRSDSDTSGANRVASSATDPTISSVVTVVPLPVIPPAASSATTAKPANAPTTTVKASTASKSTPTTAIAGQPTAADIQKVIAGIMAEVTAPADTTASTKPLTKEQVEAKVREQLKLLGITY